MASRRALRRATAAGTGNMVPRGTESHRHSLCARRFREHRPEDQARRSIGLTQWRGMGMGHLADRARAWEWFLLPTYDVTSLVLN